MTVPPSYTPPPEGKPPVHRMHMKIRGAVQGVGFRPFVFRLATDLGLTGWVLNAPEGVFLDVEGPLPTLNVFLLRLGREKPPHAFIQSLEHSLLDPAGYSAFAIRPSRETGARSAVVLPDIAPCPDCLGELFDSSDRRHLYPFINCTNCGPRYSILRSLPYDRPNTTMATFAMCPACRAEYDDPRNRRFHAQPNACPACGPQIALWDHTGVVIAARQEALLACAASIREGKILALKGVGGFQLIADARNDEAVATLRRRKHREEKPFALMVRDLPAARELCDVEDLEARLLESSERPIVILRARRAVLTAQICPSAAPGNPSLGLMLPSTPLHHLLLRELSFPVIATSGNISDEPICTDNEEALARLGSMADLFLVHDRMIHRHVDDSVLRVMAGRELVIRRARGYAPLPITVGGDTPPLLAVGPHLKNTVAVGRGGDVFISQHIGDLETAQSLRAFQQETTSLQQLFGIHPRQVVSDLHPDYLSTKAARDSGLPVLGVQHHWAHVTSCMAENGLAGDLLGVAWDGTGYGIDGTVWGGEFLIPHAGSFRRAAHLRTFPLPGGEAAVREPRRAAAGILSELHGPGFPAPAVIEEAFAPEDLDVLRRMLTRRVNSPLTSSAGRLFDAVASLLGLRQLCSFEGQAAMELEYLAEGETDDGTYPFTLREGHPEDPAVVDWGPVIEAILQERSAGVPRTTVALRFHATLASMIVQVALRMGRQRVLLSGGCFQNRILTERTIRGLELAGFRPYWHQRVPPNDGGIALGQIHAATLQHHYDERESRNVSRDSR